MTDPLYKNYINFRDWKIVLKKLDHVGGKFTSLLLIMVSLGEFFELLVLYELGVKA